MSTAHTPTKDALIADLVEALEGALEFMEGYEDVGDGDYGQPVPNRAMQVCITIRSALAKANV